MMMMMMMMMMLMMKMMVTMNDGNVESGNRLRYQSQLTSIRV